MGVRMVGSRPPADILVAPIAFDGLCEVRAEVPSGWPEGEERFVCARFRCQKGGAERTGNDCLLCEHYRGWNDGPGPSRVTISCGWSSEAPVWQRMTKASALVAVRPDLPVGEALKLAIANDVHHLLVTDDEETVGVVCRCDLGARRGDQPVSACVAPNVFAIASSATLGEAAGAMAELGIGCLPVLEQDRLAGVITRGDLFRVGGPPRIDPYFDPDDCGEGD